MWHIASIYAVSEQYDSIQHVISRSIFVCFVWYIPIISCQNRKKSWSFIVEVYGIMSAFINAISAHHFP